MCDVYMQTTWFCPTGVKLTTSTNHWEEAHDTTILLKNVRYSTPLHLPPPNSTVSVDAEIEPMTVETLALTARRTNLLDKNHPRRLNIIMSK
jgi:hypothetical protein